MQLKVNYIVQSTAKISPKLMGSLAKGYGLWIIGDLWVMVSKSLPTKLVDQKSYGI
jgi:hypothetical protein